MAAIHMQKSPEHWNKCLKVLEERVTALERQHQGGEQMDDGGMGHTVREEIRVVFTPVSGSGNQGLFDAKRIVEELNRSLKVFRG